MGVTLDYCTAEAVAPGVKEVIEGEAQHIVPPHDWWAESLCFFDGGDGRLSGATKIFLTGYSTDDGGYLEVDVDEDSLMAYRDANFIIERLAEWSQTHGLTWNIACAGESIGTITNGQWDHQLREYVNLMKAMIPWPTAFEETVKTISEKYASRW